MKKKLVLMCLAGMIVLGAGACGGKNSNRETAESEAVGAESDKGEEQTDGISRSEEKVSDRPGYVGYEELNIEEYVTLADYKNMKVSVVKPAVDDAGIESYINSSLLVGSITNRAVREGDIANIDFVGKKDGVAFDGGSGTGYKLGIGTGSFIPGFEEGLIGVMPGETVDLNLSFPEVYNPNPDFAGQEVVFTVTVNSIECSAEYAAVTEEELKNMGLPYTTKEEVWEAGKRAVEERSKETFAADAKNAAVQKLIEESDIVSVPDYFVDEETQNYNDYMASMAQAVYGMSLEDYVTGASGMTMDQYNEWVNEMSSERVKQNLVFEAFARAEGIAASREDVEKKADEEAGELGYASGEELIDEAGFATYRMYMIQDEAVERLMKIVTVEEEKLQEAD